MYTDGMILVCNPSIHMLLLVIDFRFVLDLKNSELFCAHMVITFEELLLLVLPC